MKKTILNFIRRIFGINALFESQELIINQNKEIIQAFKFNSTIVDSEWFKFKSISPGGAAIDYSFFYTLYRVLSSIKPTNILEFGLGQSSKMVHQYANFYNKKAVTVEHDPEWIDFFNKSKEGDYPVTTLLLDLETIKYNGFSCLSYQNCPEKFEGQKFDLILVDGPFGFAPDTHYSRPQIIEISKKCLSSSFIIIIDDYERKGEQATAEEIFRYFDVNHIPYVYAVYGSIKKHILITSPNNRFLTTL